MLFKKLEIRIKQYKVIVMTQERLYEIFDKHNSHECVERADGQIFGIESVVEILNEQHQRIISLKNQENDFLDEITDLVLWQEKVKEVLQKYYDIYTQKALEGKPFGDVTDVIMEIEDELGLELR